MKRVAWGVLFLGGVFAACGGKRTNTDPEYQYPTEESFCTAVSEIECNDAVVKACYGSDSATLEEDRASCQAARLSQCNPLQLPYHQEVADECILARQQALQDAIWTKDELDAVETACLPVLSKQLPDGAQCTSNFDCDSTAGLRCVIKFGSTTGVCGVPALMSGGEDCSDPLAVCDSAYYCEQQVSACLARPVMDEECSEAAPCAEDFYCSGIDPGTCVAKTKNGLGCAKDELCAGGFCIGATATMEGVCSSTLPLQINAISCDPFQ
jgi:hypothetical protein